MSIQPSPGPAVHANPPKFDLSPGRAGTEDAIAGNRKAHTIPGHSPASSAAPPRFGKVFRKYNTPHPTRGRLSIRELRARIKQDKASKSSPFAGPNPEMKVVRLEKMLPLFKSPDAPAVDEGEAGPLRKNETQLLPSSAVKKQKVNSYTMVPTKRAVHEERSRKLLTQQEDQTPSCDTNEGYHILIPGDIIKTEDSLYEIMGCLGQGTYGRVAECKDLTSSPPGQVVAVKMARAKTEFQGASQKEYQVLTLLKKEDPESLHHCICIKGFFEFQNHLCIVLPLLGMSLYTFLHKNECKPFPRDQVLEFTLQLLDGVRFLHGLGLIHTDLKPGNILIVNHRSHVFSRALESGGTESQQILESPCIKIIDFGCTVFGQDRHNSHVSTRQYRAPEITLGMGWSYPCDVFSLGCILVELYTGHYLFPSDDSLEHLALMEAVMGRMPSLFASVARKNRPDFFSGSDRLCWPKEDTLKESVIKVKRMRPLNTLIGHKHNSCKSFLLLVQRMLAYAPEERINIQEANNSIYIRLKAPLDTAQYTAAGSGWERIS